MATATNAAAAAPIPNAESTNDAGVDNQSSRGPIYVNTEHDDMIHDAQMDYYGTKLATSSSGECNKLCTRRRPAGWLL